MKRILNKTGLAILTAAAIMVSPTAQMLCPAGTVYADTRQAVIVGAVVNVRSGPSTETSRAGSLTANTSVTVTGQSTGSDGYVWYQVSYNGGNGYVRSDFISFPVAYTTDASFEAYLSQQEFPESYKTGLRQLHAKYPNWTFKAYQTGIDWNTAVSKELEGTNSLVDTDSISSWKSTDNGKFDWSTSTWPGFDGATWVAASRDIVAYYMDPRNFLNESYVFQFAVHKFNPNLQNIEGLNEMLKGTFMDKSVSISGNTPSAGSQGSGSGSSGSQTVTIVAAGPAGSSESAASTDAGSASATGFGSEALLDFAAPGEGTGTNDTTVSQAGSDASTVSTEVTVPASGTTQDRQGTSMSYAEIIMEAAQKSQENPYLLASMILQEQGKDGKSASISGASGYYNFFNVGAYAANNMSAVERGLWYASQSGSYNRPWNTIEKSIVGGAEFFAANYLNAGQDTLYLKKWNVQGSNAYKHQYMTNVQGAAEEGAKLGAAYTSDMRSASHEFSIPVYKNMPESACPLPVKDGNPNNKLRSLGLDGFTLTPGFNMDTEQYTLVVDPSVTSVNVHAVPAHSGASVSGGGSISLDGASTTVTITVTAQNGDTRSYTILINRQSGGQTNNGSMYTDAGSSSVSTVNAGSSGGPGTSSGSSSGSTVNNQSTVNIVVAGSGPS
jgi:beta-N-acetylglucosaminidase